MDNIESGVKDINIYMTDGKAEQDSMTIAANTAYQLLENNEISGEDVFGIYTCIDTEAENEASEFNRLLNEEIEITGLQADGSYDSEVRMIQEASSSHGQRADSEDYCIAVSSGGEDSAGIAYVIGSEPFLQYSEQAGVSGIHSGNDQSFDETLKDMKDALEVFKDAATKIQFSYGSSVTGNNKDLVRPENISYALFTVSDPERKREVAGRGFGNLARHAEADYLDFQTDPEERDPVEYLENIFELEEFQNFYSRTVETTETLENSVETTEPVTIGLQRASALQDLEKNSEGEYDDLIMAGTFGIGGRSAEVHAEEVIDTPNLSINGKEVQKDDNLEEILEADNPEPLFFLENGERKTRS